MDLKRLDLNLLVLFETVYSTGAIGQAAKRLNITQPAVSNGLKRLRELMDDPLFARSGRGVEPTPKARRLIGPVREALGIISRQLGTADTIDLATYKRHFRIVTVDVLEAIIMPPIIRQIDHLAPGVSIESVQGSREFANELRVGTLDLACFSFVVEAPEIRSVPIGSFDLVVGARRGHPAIRGKLDAATFRSLGHITLARELRSLTNIEKDLVNNQVTRRTPYMVAKMWSKPAIIESTDLIGLLPRRFAEFVAAHYAIDIHELPLPFAEQQMYMLWHERSDADPGHRWLRESLLAALEPAPIDEPIPLRRPAARSR